MNSKNSKKRVDLILRLQGYANDPIIEVIEYLKSLPIDEMRQRINSFLVAGFLPYARYHKGNCEAEKLRYVCWESQDSLSKHGSHMRFALGVEQPQFVQPSQFVPQFSMPTTAMMNTIDGNVQAQTNIPFQADDEIDEQPESLIQGKMSAFDIDRIFGD